jgi:hypothetical protein
MFDTTVFGFQIEPSRSQLQSWDWHGKNKIRDGRTWETHKTYLHLSRGSTMEVCYYPQNVSATKKTPLLKLKFSLAKSYFGTNSLMLMNAHDAIEQVNQELRIHSQIPPLDLNHGIIYGIDICCNHQVGENVSDYIHAYSKLYYPHRSTIYYPPKEVLFKTKTISTKFYDKELECGLPGSYGILRQETTLRDKGKIEELLGIPNPTINSITKEFSQKILMGDLHSLRIDEQIITCKELASEILISRYGSLVGYRLMGYLDRRQYLTKKQIIEMDHHSNARLSYIEKQITDAGVSMALLETNKALLPLKIDFNIQNT